MDLERAMEFMVEQQAQMQARHERMQVQQERMQAHQERMQAHQERMQAQQERMQAQLEQMQVHQAQFESDSQERMAKLEKWFLRGAKMVVVNRKAIKETDERITALVFVQQGNEQRLTELHAANLATQEALRETQATLAAFINSMRRSGNGH